MAALASESMWQRRLWGYVLGAFAFLALLLAAVGLNGVMSYLVSMRTRELGIRLAVGSSTGGIIRLVLQSGMQLVVTGIAIGLAGAWFASRLLSSLLFGVRATDAATYSAVAMLLIGVAAGACAVPAWRASRVDPLDALRAE